MRGDRPRGHAGAAVASTGPVAWRRQPPVQARGARADRGADRTLPGSSGRADLHGFHLPTRGDPGGPVRQGQSEPEGRGAQRGAQETELGRQRQVPGQLPPGPRDDEQPACVDAAARRRGPLAEEGHDGRDPAPADEGAGPGQSQVDGAAEGDRRPGRATPTADDHQDRAGESSGRPCPDLQPRDRLWPAALSVLSALRLLPALLSRRLSRHGGDRVRRRDDRRRRDLGRCNWGRSDIDIDVNRRNNFNRNVNRGDRVSPRTADRAGGARGDRASWQHNPEHRKGAQLEAATFGFGAFQPLSLLEKPGASKIVFSLGIDAGQAHLDRGKLVLPDRAIEKLVVPGVGVREPARAVGQERDRKWEVVVPDDRDSATQQKFNRGTDSARAASRESFRGRAEQERRELARGGAGQGAARSREGGFGSAGGAQRAGGVGQGGAGSGRGEGALGSGGGQRGGQVGTGGGRAFEGAGQGQRHRSYTERGQSSRGSSSYSSGGSRGGGGFSGDGGGRGGGGRDRGGGRR